MAKAIIKERAYLALKASWEISALIGVIQREQARDDNTEFEEVLLPVLLRRMADVTSVIMSALGGDDGRKTEEMREVIHG